MGRPVIKFFVRNLQAELHATVDKLRESQTQIAALMTTKKALEFEIQEYKVRYEQIKEILKVILLLFVLMFFYV